MSYRRETRLQAAVLVAVCLTPILAAPAPAPAPSSAPVPLPANLSVCSKADLTRVTSSPSACGKALYDPWSRKYTPGASCCARLASAYGAKASAPTRGCLCVPSVWQRFNSARVKGNIDFGSLLDTCAKTNSSWTVPYYQNGTGTCAGKAAKTSTSTAKAASVTTATASKPRSAGQWFAGLRHDWLVLVSFMSSLVAALGFLLIAWPFVHDLIFDFAKLCSSFRPGRFSGPKY